MKVIALYSIKGGVGKTASAVNLAFVTAKAGFRTLLWDLDPQGASSYYFRIKPKVKGGSKDLIAGKRPLDGLIKGTDFEKLDLLPADFSFRNLDLELDDKKKPTKQLKKLLAPLADDYDFIFLDCPPSISLLSEAVFAASDALLSPIIPTTLSVRTLDQLQSVLTEKELSLMVLPFFSMLDKRKKMHREIMLSLTESYPATLKTTVPYSSEIERMGVEANPLAAYSHKNDLINTYNSLWQEVIAALSRTE